MDLLQDLLFGAAQAVFELLTVYASALSNSLNHSNLLITDFLYA